MAVRTALPDEVREEAALDRALGNRPRRERGRGMRKKLKEGWAFIANARKFHYVGTDGRSLCGKWLFLGTLIADDQKASKSKDDCVTCRKRRNKIDTRE